MDSPKPTITLKSQQLATLSRIAIARGKLDGYARLTGVALREVGGKLEVFATDGKILALTRLWFPDHAVLSHVLEGKVKVLPPSLLVWLEHCYSQWMPDDDYWNQEGVDSVENRRASLPASLILSQEKVLFSYGGGPWHNAMGFDWHDVVYPDYPSAMPTRPMKRHSDRFAPDLLVRLGQALGCNMPPPGEDLIQEEPQKAGWYFHDDCIGAAMPLVASDRGTIFEGLKSDQARLHEAFGITAPTEHAE